MQNFYLSLFVVSLLVFSFALSIGAQITKEENGLTVSALPQAEPVYNLLKALEISDFKLFLSAFDSKAVEFVMYGRRKKDWPKLRKEWKADFKDELGEYKLDDLRFAVDIEEPTRSVVFIVYKGKHLHGMNVSKRAGKWKIIEL